MYFLYHRTTAPTGRILAEALRMPSGYEGPARREDVLVRWGSTASIGYKADFTVNPAFAIARATNKLESLERMRERGVVVPDFARNPAELEAPFLGRTIQHTRGQDIVLCMQQADARRDPRDYYVRYIPVAKEYRARVVGDRCVRISEKVYADTAPYVPWIRNHSNGYVFQRPEIRLNEFQQALAVSAVNAHGLHFGAVDMVVSDNGMTYVLEVNTAPSLAPLSALSMVGGLCELINDRTGIVIEPDLEVLAQLSTTDDDGDTEDGDGEVWF